MNSAATRVNKVGVSTLVAALVLGCAGGTVALKAESASVPVRMSRTPEGRVALDVTDGDVSLRKEVWATGSLVTITTGDDRLTMEVSGSTLTIGNRTGQVSLGADGLTRTGEVLAFLHRSEAAAKGRALLNRVADGPNTFAGQSLLLTRVLLEAGAGATSAFNQHRRWVADRAAARRSAAPSAGLPRVIRAAWQKSGTDRGPGDCWDLYSAEAIRIADDFSECVDDAYWYEYPGCVAIYTVRAEAAMFWFIQCSGGFPFGK